MRFFFFFVFTAIVSVQSLQGFFTLVNWKINQAEITEKFCENKDKPILKCNGKCHLMKQLKLQEEQDEADASKPIKKAPLKYKKIKSSEWFEDKAYTFSLENSIQLVNRKPIFELFSNYSNQVIESCFHPPQV